jgi:hypothetical protein
METFKSAKVKWLNAEARAAMSGLVFCGGLDIMGTKVRRVAELSW